MPCLRLSLLALVVAVLTPALARAGDRTIDLVRYDRQLLDIVRANRGQCAKAVTAVQRFHDTNLPAFQRLRQENRAYRDSLDAKGSQAYANRHKQLMTSLFNESEAVLVQFRTGCPKQMPTIRKLLGDFGVN